MAEGTEVAKGYISISPSLAGFRATLQRELSKITADIAKATGAQYGAEFSSATAAGVKSAGGQVDRAADAAGKSAGAKLGDGLTSGAKSGAAGAAKAVDGLAAEAESRFARMGESMKTALTVAGAAAGAAITAAVVDSMGREVGTDRVAAALGLTPEDARRVAGVSADIYKGAWGESTDEVNAALQAVMLNISGMSTASDAELKAVTTTAMDLANAFGIDVTGATAAVGTMMKTGMAGSAQEAFDIITAGFQAGVDKRGDFLDTLTEYSTQFQKLGIDGTLATGLLSQGLEGGARDADKVADALKELSIRAIDGSQSTADAYALLGLNGEQMTAQFAAGGESASAALQTVLDSLRNMDDPVAQSAAAVGLFGTQAEDLGAALYSLDPSTAVSTLGQVGGAAEEMGAVLNDNVATDIEGFKRGLQDLGLQLVEKTGTFGAFSAAALGFAPAIGSVVGPMAQVTMAMSALNLATIKATASMILNKIAFVASNALYIAKVGIIGAVTIAQWALNAALTANPIGIVVMAIAALIGGLVLLYKNNETVREVIDKVWSAIREFIGGVVDWFKETVPAAWETVKNAVTGTMDTLKEFVNNAWQGIKDFIDGVVTWFTETVPAAWERVKIKIQVVMDQIRAKVDGVMVAIRTGIDVVMNAIKSAWDFVWNAIKTATDNVMAGIKWAIDTALNAIKTAFDNITAGVQWVWDNTFGRLGDVATTAMDNIKNNISTALERVKSLFSGAVDAIGGIWNKVSDVVKKPIGTMFQWINDSMIGPLNSVITKFSTTLSIPTLPKFHTGGYTGDAIGGREGLALLRNDEFVMAPGPTKQFRPLLEAMNAGRNPIQAQAAAAAEQGYGIGWGVWDKLQDALAAGARAAIDFVANPILDQLQSRFGGSWSSDFVIGGMRRAVDGIREWAKRSDESTAGGYAGPPTAVGDYVRPLSRYAVTSEWMRSGADPRHFGIDLGAPAGQAIFAIAAGKVMESVTGWGGGFGNYVRLDHGRGLSTLYAHMLRTMVRVGQTVTKGQVIGQVGSTGMSTGPHLHFEGHQNGRPFNPRWLMSFDSGGFLPPGLSMTYNGTGRPEPVLTDKQWKAITDGGAGNSYVFNVAATQVPTEDAMLTALRRADAIYGGI